MLRQHYADTPTAALAAQLGRSVVQVYCAAERYGLRKSDAYLAAAGRRLRGDNVGAEQRFKPGHAAWNKGKPGHAPWNKGKPGSTGRHPNSVAHHFQPGRAPSEARNYLPIGTMREAKGILECKVTDNPAIASARRWVAVARLVWEAAHGPVPCGHVVVFRPGQRTTEADQITLDRLELVTRAELMRRNSYHTNLSPELARAVQLRGALQRQINKREKEST